MTRKLLGLLTPRQRWHAALLLVALIVRATVELVGVASVVPFMAVVANPDTIHQNWFLRGLYVRGGFESNLTFLQALGVASVVLLAVSNGVSALATWFQLRMVWKTNYELSNRLFEAYLAQPYNFFVQRNSARLHKALLNEVGSVMTGVLTPALNVISQGLVVLTMSAMLVLLDPVLAVSIVLVLGGSYGLIYLTVRRRQSRVGQIRLDMNLRRFQITSEAFGGIKDVKILQREHYFLAQFKPPSWRFSQVMVSNGTISQLPRNLLETIAFGGILLIVLYYIGRGQGISQILPMLSLYAMAGYRLMPAFQNVFAGVTAIRFNLPALDDLWCDLSQFSGNERVPVPAAEKLPFHDAVRIENISFGYPRGQSRVLDGASLTIKKNQIIGLAGTSGAGKTTLADILLGLYSPESGTVTVDGTPLDAGTVSAWRRQVGYVPQQIFLVDDTIARNIAFGIAPEEIDRDRVERAARIAHLHDFIQQLPQGYDTVVGERGIRLSGGQRQRIGIARALYEDPEVLVMDEATNALDGVTEDAIMEAIHELAGRKTIVLIAHRLSTMSAADCIFLIEGGRVAAQGSYQELLRESEAFRALARVASKQTFIA